MWPGRACIVALTGVMSACGGGSSISTTAPVTPTAPPAQTNVNAWSVTGQVVATGTAQPVGGAHVQPTWNLPAVTSDAQGGFQLGDSNLPPSDPYSVSVSGTGLITHDMWISWQRGDRSGVTLDAIRDAPPFSMDFYRQLVRGTYDQPNAPWAWLGWTSAPSFYVRTVDQNGRPIEPEVLAVVLDAIRRAVPAWTGGKLSALAVDSGVEDRPQATGWINVNIRRDPSERRTCGQAFVGANPGTITLNDDVCSCGSIKIPGAVVLHEVGHALGYFHVSDTKSIMYPFAAGDCPAGALSAAEAYHAAIAYTRPRGNTDPDHDPSSARALTLTPPLVK
jgi:Matrixin